MLYYFFFSACNYFYVFFFFFQAEDGIRDLTVTGVQTCALPILIPLIEDSAGPEPGRIFDQRDYEFSRCSWGNRAPYHDEMIGISSSKCVGNLDRKSVV